MPAVAREVEKSMTIDNLMWFAGGTVFGTINLAWIFYVFMINPLLHNRSHRRTEPQG